MSPSPSSIAIDIEPDRIEHGENDTIRQSQIADQDSTQQSPLPAAAHVGSETDIESEARIENTAQRLRESVIGHVARGSTGYNLTPRANKAGCGRDN